MTLQRRLLLYLLICAPLVWLVAMGVSLRYARHEVDELFDAEMIRLARQVQATLVPDHGVDRAAIGPRPASTGEADLRELAVAVWDRHGRLLVSDREGVLLPYRPDALGFVDVVIDATSWRVYYLQSFDGDWLVAAGQQAHERDELSFGLTLGQLLPWLLMLPVLLVAMAWAVRRALAPLHQISADLRTRRADALQPVAGEHAPAELKPLLAAMNGLFARIEDTLARERRFTADAAHELRTPLAVLRAQWDVVRRAAPGAERDAAETRLGLGLARMDRLVTQLLALSRLEAGTAPGAADPALQRAPVHWPVVVEQAVNDCLALADRRDIELECLWAAPAGVAPLPLQGDEHLLTVLLRNLLDNALRYAPLGSQVQLRIGADRLEVENAGPALAPEQLARLGERFYRPDGQDEVGSGLGLSIVRRIAALHSLVLSFAPGPGGGGLRVSLAPA